MLADESVEDLTAEALQEIALRDSLGVSSESVLFNALERWCNRECKRQKMQLSVDSRRSVLGQDLIFCPRYLLMSSQQFVCGPMQSGLLNQSEATTLMAHILNTHAKPTALSLSPEVLKRLRTPRHKPYGSPVNLKSTKCKKDKQSCSKKLKNVKKQKKGKCRDSKKEPPGKKCSGACFLEYMFRGLSCLFD